MSDVRSVLAVQATLGEGPVWVERDQALWFVDIKNHKVHRFDPATGDHKSYDAPGQVGWILPSDDSTFLAGLQQGVARFDPATGAFDVIATPEAAIPTNRLNDAAVDAQGRIWFGSMDDGEGAATGRLYRFDRGVVADTGLAPVTITNGPAISPDGRTLYHTDTLGRIIHRVPIQDDGSLGTPSVFATIDEADGWPDGAVCDAEGFVWTGLWGGWRARRYSPAGDIVAEVRLPAANVTKIAFGGADLRTAYATTARKGLDADALAGQPLAGNIFAFQVDVPGMPGNLASLG
ncbi:SMP-30/gluconolactonase/LRE family protein [Sphingomonas sp. ASY06-1R]|uniref:SMP-30/gluconolactonase/LRE family protein n=1 Tax=Sphingomonas sp. ASY06-1R TaxID=3445771 RepID=UPI003FA24F51